MDLSDASKKIPSDMTGDRSGELPTTKNVGFKNYGKIVGALDEKEIPAC
jgi:hypothetical protein